MLRTARQNYAILSYALINAIIVEVKAVRKEEVVGEKAEKGGT